MARQNRAELPSSARSAHLDRQGESARPARFLVLSRSSGYNLAFYDGSPRDSYVETRAAATKED
jgi:hypothetical protein